ncbi:MAG: WYL domain-containing protein [Actinobacteria bacterium]|nr:MAG: WYL domain-containing protein [Actinomycetota bacterium]
MHPLERLVNLVALLLESRRPLTFEQIRTKMPEGYGQDDLQSAKRMFERDKDVLRDIGVPIEVIATDAWEVEQGYAILKDRYYLPEIDFTPEEISALFVAAHAGGPDDAAEQAVRKLLYGTDGGLVAGAASAPLAAEAGAVDARLTAAAEAIAERRSVRFAYRTSRGVESERHVDPWGLVFRAGHWYLVGLDRERDEIRAFRLSRAGGELRLDGEAGPPPEGFRAVEHVVVGPFGPGEPEERATVAFSPDVAWWATRGVLGALIQDTRSDGWVQVSLPAAPGDALASWILSFGPDAVAVAPESLRAEIVHRLEAARR